MFFIENDSPILSKQPGVRFRADWKNRQGEYWWQGVNLVLQVKAYCLFPNSRCRLWFVNSDQKVNDRPVINIGSAKIVVKPNLFNLVHGTTVTGPVKSRCKNDCVYPLHLKSCQVTPALDCGKWGAGVLECLSCGKGFDSWSKKYNRNCETCTNSMTNDSSLDPFETATQSLKNGGKRGVK